MPRPKRIDWPAHLVDPRVPLVIDPAFLGWQRRRDGWKVRGFRDHRHRLWLVEEGVVTLRADGRPFRLAPGAGAWLPAGVQLDCDWPADLALREVYCATGSTGGDAIIAEGAWEIGALIDHIAAEFAGAARPHRDARVRHLLALALVTLARCRDEPRRAGLDPAVRDRVVRWARDHLRARPEPADLARIAGLSPDWFARAFRAAFGRSPRRWLADERIRAAARSLGEGAGTVAAVAAAHGFADVAQFARRFRAVMGTAPGTWCG
jgi:AraC-like DNA-binding protein